MAKRRLKFGFLDTERRWSTLLASCHMGIGWVARVFGRTCRLVRIRKRRRARHTYLKVEQLEPIVVPSAVQLKLTSYTVQENQGQAVIDVSLDSAVNQTVTVNYSTSDSSALAGTNYTATSGTLTFQPDQLDGSFTVPILMDGQNFDPPLSFNVALSNPTNANLGTNSSATVTINDESTYHSGTRPSATTLTTSDASAEYSEAITLTATVAPAHGAGAPTGYVSFYDGTTLLGEGAINASTGQATFTIMTLAAGSHDLTALYSGDSDFEASQSDTLTQNIAADPATTTTLASSVNPTVLGQSTTFTATVQAQAPAQGTPTGTVVFKYGSNTLGSATLNSSGQASLAVSSLPVGTDTVTAYYSGDQNFGTSNGSVNQQVNNPVPSLSSISPTSVGEGSGSVTLTVNGSNFVTNSVVQANGNNLSTTFVSGTQLTAVLASSYLTQDGTIAITVANPTPGGGTSGSLTFTVLESDLTVTAQAITATENAGTGTVQVATFTDPGSDTSGAFAASINWGDGSTSTGTVTGSSGTFTVTGSHTYTNTDGVLPTTVTVTETGLGTASGTSTATVSEADLTVTAQAIGATENSNAAVQVATFTDPGADTSGSFTASINWGDGSTSAGTISGSNGTFTVTGSHTYSNTDGIFTTSVTVSEPGVPGSTASSTSTATVSESDLAVTAHTVAVGENVSTGSVTVATFTDPGADTSGAFTASINWGDGSSSTGTVTGSNGTFTVTGSHTYTNNDGTFTTTVTVTETGISAATASSTSTATVAEADLSATAQNFAATENAGTGSIQVATFTDPGADTSGEFTASINWGDGSTSAGTVTGSNGTFTVTGGHVYSDAGQDSVTVTISEDGLPVASASESVTVADAALTLQAQNIAAVAGTDTGSIQVATLTDANTAATTADYTTVSINWGDGHTTAGTLVAQGNGVFTVMGDHTYQNGGNYSLQVTVTDEEGATAQAGAHAYVVGVLSTSNIAQRSTDPQNGFLVPIGEAQVDPNTGSLQISQPLDFDQSPSTTVGGNPALVYNSNTVDVRPIIKVVIPTDSTLPLPTSIDLQLTWNGTQQSSVSFSTAGHQAGDTLVLAVQVAGPVQTTGVYGWSILATIHMPGNLSVQETVSGSTPVVVAENSPYGAGWGIQGIDRLVAVQGGVMWVTGTGDYRYFAASGNGTFTSPPEDFGTLVQNQDGSYTYTDPHQVRTTFNAQGLLTSIVTPDQAALGLGLFYQYNAQGGLTQVTAPDGGVTTLSYSNGLLQSITEPGGRVVSLTHSGTDLTQITDAAGFTRTLAYNSVHQLTSDQWAPYSASFSYDANTGLLSALNFGGGSVWTLAPAAAQGLQTNPASNASQENVATLTDGLGHTTTYSVDLRGRETSMKDADGNVETWALNAAGLVTQYTDQRGFSTNYSYDSFGDVTCPLPQNVCHFSL
jgi:YD repeat-containing protein